MKYLLLVLLLLASCGGSGAAEEKVAAVWERISADGCISKEEAQEFAAALSTSQDQESSIDWPTTLVSLVGAFVPAFFGVNIYRNRREKRVWGPPPPKVKA